LALPAAYAAGLRWLATLAARASAGGALGLSVHDDIGLNAVDNVFKSQFEVDANIFPVSPHSSPSAALVASTKKDVEQVRNIATLEEWILGGIVS
jgi:hypothetical protein